MSTSRRPAVLAVSGLALVCLAGGAFYLSTTGEDAAPGTAAGASGPTTTAPAAATPSPVSTQAGTGAGENRLEPGPAEVVATDPAPEEDTAGSTVAISYADAASDGIEVGGFVSGIVEDGGTCEATATRGAQQVTVQGVGIADASTTSCGGLVLAAADLSAGTWSVRLRYESGGTSLVSAPVDVQVAS